jgi:hypothetical protein
MRTGQPRFSREIFSLRVTVGNHLAHAPKLTINVRSEPAVEERKWFVVICRKHDALVLKDSVGSVKNLVRQEFVAEVFSIKKYRDSKPIVPRAKTYAIDAAWPIYSVPFCARGSDRVADDNQESD